LLFIGIHQSAISGDTLLNKNYVITENEVKQWIQKFVQNAMKKRP
jgi:hypothetical protein